MFPLCMSSDSHILLLSLQEKTQYTFNCIFTINKEYLYKNNNIWSMDLFSIIHFMYVQYIRLIVYMSVWNSKIQNAFKASHLSVQTAAVQPNLSSIVSQYYRLLVL